LWVTIYNIDSITNIKNTLLELDTVTAESIYNFEHIFIVYSFLIADADYQDQIKVDYYIGSNLIVFNLRNKSNIIHFTLNVDGPFVTNIINCLMIGIYYHVETEF